MRHTVAGLFLFLIPFARPAQADVIDEAWKRGNTAYHAARQPQDYEAAIAAYSQIDRQGVVAPDLYYNLGNAYYKRGNLGAAIWSYERALALDPGDEDTRFNLAQARRLAERRVRDRLDGADRDPTWIRIVTALRPSTEAWAFVGLYLCAFAALWRVLRAPRGDRAALGALVAILFAGAAGSGILLAGRTALDRLPFGIVLPESVSVREGADPNHRVSFEVHAGLRVRLLERDQDWIRIRLGNGLDGWVRAQDVGRI